MTLPAADSVKVLWTGTGTGTLSLGSAISGFQAFPTSLNGAVISYSIEHENGTERENGIGTYTSSGTTLTRDLVTFSTAGAPTKVTFTAGTKHVRLTALAGDLIENRATTNPTVNDDLADGYIAGRSRWLNTTSDALFFCVDHTNGAAVWVEVGVGSPGFKVLRGTQPSTRDLADGAGTITLTNPMFEISGTAAAAFDLTIASGTTTGETVHVVVTGNPGSFIIPLVHAGSPTESLVSRIRQDHIYVLRWTGTAWSNRGRFSRTNDATGVDTLGTLIFALPEITDVDQTNDFLILRDATDSLAKRIRWTGRREVTIDGANYSAGGSPTNAPYTPVNRNRHVYFTAAQDHIIEIPAGLSTTPPVYGKWFAPPANTLTIRRVAGSGVSINAVADDGFTWVVPAGGAVEWEVISTNTVWMWGDSAGSFVMTGDLDFADFILSRPELKDFSETLVTDSVSGAVTRDFSTANNHSLTLTGNVTSLTISNPPATGRVGVITFRIIQDATGGRAWAHPSIIRWPGGTAPTLPTGANDVSILSYLTFNGGTHWYGFEGGLDFL